MLDINLFRHYDENLLKDYCYKRNIDFSKILDIIEKDKEIRNLLTNIQENKAKINKISDEFKIYLKDKNDSKLIELKNKVQNYKNKNVNLEEKYITLKNEIEYKLKTLPNIPNFDVPYGLDETDNIEKKQVGKPKIFDFDFKPHWDIMVENDMVDLDAATSISGSRYVMYKKNGAKLIRALQWYTLECNINHGYTEYLPPVIVDESALYNTGQLPKFKEDLYKIEKEEKYLSPTAEVQLTNLNANKILSSSKLPLYYTSNTSCFRSEAGSAGRDTRGVIRQHQFYKTELVKICMPNESDNELESLTRNAEYILESLNLPYRRILLCSNDMGFSAKKTYDIEVWLPSYNSYKEISSCSNCGDFQSRRMKMRVKDENGKIIYPHTLNGSSLAIDRLFAAILENYQEKDGRVKIPEVLKKYFDNQEYI